MKEKSLLAFVLLCSSYGSCNDYILPETQSNKKTKRLDSNGCLHEAGPLLPILLCRDIRQSNFYEGRTLSTRYPMQWFRFLYRRLNL